MVQKRVDFDVLSKCIAALGVPHSAAEVHGLVTGLLSAGSKMSPAAGLSTLREWLDTDVVIDATHGALLSQVFRDVAADLLDPEFNFHLLLPDDEAAIALRSQALGEWCSGFLGGFGLAGRFQNGDLSDDLRELLADLSNIANLDEEVPEDEDNEGDLIEIEEYVRMSALLVFAECAVAVSH
jgi:uncharacterized protein YgfB (UPF0149 family)